MGEIIRFVIAAVLMLGGVISAGISILGVYRFKFVMNRMHCAAILDTVAMAGIVGGLMVATGNMQYIPKLFAALLVLWISSPAASHLVGRMEMTTDETASEHIPMKEDTDGSH